MIFVWIVCFETGWNTWLRVLQTISSKSTQSVILSDQLNWYLLDKRFIDLSSQLHFHACHYNKGLFPLLTIFNCQWVHDSDSAISLWLGCCWLVKHKKGLYRPFFFHLPHWTHSKLRFRCLQDCLHVFLNWWVWYFLFHHLFNNKAKIEDE